jgi:hypothetical protein
METIIDNVSYFNPPIGNTTPEITMSLHAVSKLVKMGDLQRATNKVRAGLWSKTEILPYITPSGCFTRRMESEIVSYSGIVSIDLDDLDVNYTATAAATAPAPATDSNFNCQLSTVNCQLISTSAHQHINSDWCNSLKIREINSLKHIIFADKFLNPAFIFVSPSGRGLKIFIRIHGAEASFHKDYFRVLSLYFKQQYDITVDQACSDVSRACLLCHDPEALFSLFSGVSHADLITKLPPEPPEPPAVISLLSSLYSHFYHGTDYTRYRSDKLNNCTAVHEHALDCLAHHGWVQNGLYFCRPGKTNSRAVSAKFCIPPNYKIFIFYVYTSNAPNFTAGQGYTDCMVISQLQFDGDYDRCINVLYKDYDDLMRA